MSEGGDILYVKPASMKPRTQQQLQQTAEKARKHIPGAARSVVAAAAASDDNSINTNLQVCQPMLGTC